MKDDVSVTARSAPEPISVVLADDHAAVRAGIRGFLESAGITILAEAGDGPTAMAAIRDLRPDVAILDIRMPGASGIEIAAWVRENCPSTGVLVLTAYDDEPYVRAALKAGASGFLLKNADAAEIVRTVREVSQGRSVLDPAIARKVMADISGEAGGLPVEKLTERELEVLGLVARGHTNKSIGFMLGISDRTVQGHLARICDKLLAASRTEAVMRAVSLGWISPEIGRMEQK